MTMINGNGYESPREEFVRHVEFKPVVDKVEYLVLEHTKASIIFENFSKNSAEMFSNVSKNINSMAENIQKLTDLCNSLTIKDQVNAKIKMFLVKISAWFIGISGTCITAHFTGVIKMLSKVIS